MFVKGFGANLAQQRGERSDGDHGRGGARDKVFGWGVGSLVVVVFALLPVAWIVSLSLKQPGDFTDGKFLPNR